MLFMFVHLTCTCSWKSAFLLLCVGMMIYEEIEDLEDLDS
jgi:hypothetical protein